MSSKPHYEPSTISLTLQISFRQDKGDSENQGYLIWGPGNKDPTIQGTTLVYQGPVFSETLKDLKT